MIALAVAAPAVICEGGWGAPGARAAARRGAAELDALRRPELVGTVAGEPVAEHAESAIDGRDETAWTGQDGGSPSRWTSLFAHPVHLGLVRAHFGTSATSGVPVAFRWEVLRRGAEGPTCGPAASGDDGWSLLAGSDVSPAQGGDRLARPTRRSWFVDDDACGLRLVVDRTNAGPPVLREVEAIESARNVLQDGRATDDGAYPGFRADAVIDGVYATRWAGAPGRSRWTLRVDLPEPKSIDRIRLVLGFDATSVPRPGSGRNYAVAWAPIRYSLESSADGKRFVPVASEPTRADGSSLPVRRRLVTLPEARTVRSLRLVMSGATGDSGLPARGAVPVVREIAAYAEDDKRPILAAPWLLSINANPSGQSHVTPGGEVCNDAYHAKFLQSRFIPLLPALRNDDRFARSLGPRGEPLDAPPRDEAGEALESIEGDDPQLDSKWLAENSPPPIAVMSGSNDWDYAAETGPDPARPKRWRWDPLRGARLGGMAQLTAAVHDRAVPFLGFCGGAQILALLESRQHDKSASTGDLRAMDHVLRRNDGRPVRGFAQPADVVRAWPTDSRPVRVKVEFAGDDRLFGDLTGSLRRSVTRSLPELHADAIRPDAFLPGGPLERFDVVASSAFCSPSVVAAGPRDGVFPDPSGAQWCATVPEAFRSRDGGWPIIGTQFHAEQRDFSSAAPDDPPESTADPFLFLAAAYETLVDSYVKLGP